ncbi:MAG TPA: EamA family transporter, partial [Vicinamibacteria bacterium]
MESQLWFVYAVVTTLSWGVWGAFIERPEKNGFPATLGYAVWALTMVPCAAVALAVLGSPPEHDLRSVVLGSAAGLLGAAGQLVLFDALRRGPAYLVFPVVSLSPVVSVLLSVVLLGETASPRAWAGIVLALLAMPLLSFQPRDPRARVEGRVWFLLALVVFLAWGIQAYVLRFANATMRSESLFFYMALTALLLAPVAWRMTDFAKPVNWGASGAGLAFPVQLLNSIG